MCYDSSLNGTIRLLKIVYVLLDILDIVLNRLCYQSKSYVLVKGHSLQKGEGYVT